MMSENKFLSSSKSISSFSSFKSSSGSEEGETMNKERVYCINRINPDPFLDNWKTPPALNKKSRLMRIVYDGMKKPDSYDISIHIDNDIFNCFMLTLQSYSKFFQQRSKHEKVIKLSSSRIQPIVFHKIYEWMLSSSKMVDRDGLIPLLLGAQHLEIQLLVQQIWNLIQDGQKFQECEAFLLYLEAKHWGCEKVKTMMTHRVQRFYMTVVASEEYLLLEPNEVASWLKMDGIAINLEVEVFYSASRWLLHDWNERKKHQMSLMQHVRFGLIAACQIVDFRKNKNMGKLQRILSNSELQTLLESSLNYATYRNCFKDESSEQFTDFLHRFGYKRLYSREVVDPEWSISYHDSSYSYEQFEEYLNIIRSNAFSNWRTK